ncbi:MAG: type II toxin-antitoxin system RelE/ParE family toxin [Chitinispirillaceae bacterium]|nr:type II toxin-antitoxin system RelE/ParE family toxin [Chitinispirillaceae bacterium]
MKKIVRFLLPAELEMLDAARFYELQATGLGGDFLNKIEQAIKDISEDPEKWPTIHVQIRRRLIHRFPYALLYRIDPDEVLIIATMHLHRHPDYWIGR